MIDGVGGWVEEADVEFGTELVALYVGLETGGLGRVDFDEEAVDYAAFMAAGGVLELGVDDDVVEDATFGGQESSVDAGCCEGGDVGCYDALEVLCGVGARDAEERAGREACDA